MKSDFSHPSDLSLIGALGADYGRDLVGYGGKPPHPQWPGDAAIALQFVVNYEEGGENCLLHGDGQSEAFLSEISGAEPWPGQRHMSMESLYEYGSRAGFWRLYREFSARQMPITIFGVTSALLRNPDAVEAMKSENWEIACHGLKWIDYRNISQAEEREHIERAIVLHEQATGSRPYGWYTGRTSQHTRTIIQDVGGFLYDADSYADDLPYWVPSSGGGYHLVIPYSLDNNDMRFSTASGFGGAEQFFHYLKDSFDILYREGEQGSPKMMSIGLHCRLIGRPGRMMALVRFLDYVSRMDRVWIAKRIDIAGHWHALHAPALPTI